MNRLKPKDAATEAMKAAFIAKNGVTKCSPGGREEPAGTGKPYHSSPSSQRPQQAAQPAVATAAPSPVLQPKAEPKVAAPQPIPVRDLGTKPVLMWVPTSQLNIDHSYQRAVSTKRGMAVIKDIVTKFQWPLFQPITITQREEGGYWVIDGQHRMTAAKEIGIREIPAVLLENLTQTQQALAFAGINGKRVSVNAYAIHHAMVAAADEMSVRLDTVCKKVDVAIPRYPKMVSVMKPNETLSIAAMKAAMKNYGDDALIWSLRLLRTTFPDEVGVLSPTAIRALPSFFSTYADYPIHDKTIQAALLDCDPEALREEAARQTATPPQRLRYIVEALARAYNAQLPVGRKMLPVSA